MINIKDIFSKAINFVKSNKYINKYTIALVIFLIIYIFCSEHSYIKTKKLERQIEKTDKQIEYYETNIKNNRAKQAALESNKQEVEKYAREQLNMKKENEDIYYIEEK